jgi:putative endonuclease
VAQLGARLDGIEEVVGSNPIGSTKFSPVHFLYILQSETSGRYYIGQTQDVSERLTYHNANYSKSLKNRGPWRLVHTEQFKTRSEAVARERQLKSGSAQSAFPRVSRNPHTSPCRSSPALSLQHSPKSLN